MRLLCWNIHLGRRLAAVAGHVTASGSLQVIALQEASVHGGVEDAEAIARRLGPDYRAWQVTAQQLRGVPQANALVWDSRYLSVEDMEELPLPAPAGRLLRTLPASRRSALRLEGRTARGSLRVYNIHLDVLGLRHKAVQFEHVLKDAERRPPADLVLIAGDLNTYGPAQLRPWTALRRLAEQAGFADVTARVGWTHSAGAYRQKLDAVYARPAGGARARVLPVQRSHHVSDHRPLLVELP